jgi:hypothetical protein
VACLPSIFKSICLKERWSTTPGRSLLFEEGLFPLLLVSDDAEWLISTMRVLTRPHSPTEAEAPILCYAICLHVTNEESTGLTSFQSILFYSFFPFATPAGSSPKLLLPTPPSSPQGSKF